MLKRSVNTKYSEINYYQFKKMETLQKAENLVEEQFVTYRESRLRSFLKGLSWRIIATTTIICIVYFKKGSIEMALEIGAIEFFLKFAIYYFHERLWQLVPRGGVRKRVREFFKKKK